MTTTERQCMEIGEKILAECNEIKINADCLYYSEADESNARALQSILDQLVAVRKRFEDGELSE